MKLTLTISNADELLSVEDRFRVWENDGGSIGRFDGNDWVLPDPQSEISRVHARVYFSSDTFFIEDLSTNGVFVSDRQHRIDRVPHAISNGDIIFIGHYEIHALVTNGGQQVETSDTDTAAWSTSETFAPEPLAGSIDDLYNKPSAIAQRASVIDDHQLGVSAQMTPVTPIVDPIVEEKSVDTIQPVPTKQKAVVGSGAIPENWWDDPVESMLSEWAGSDDLESNDGHKNSFQEPPAFNENKQESSEKDKSNVVCEKSEQQVEAYQSDNKVDDAAVNAEFLKQHLIAQKLAFETSINALLNQLEPRHMKKLLSTIGKDKDGLLESLYQDVFCRQYERKLDQNMSNVK
ncbi:MAG: type VI secretion system-associated FHA domain protein [Cellvibrionaceae bacterium]